MSVENPQFSSENEEQKGIVKAKNFEQYMRY